MKSRLRPLALEPLEGRTLMSTCHVNRLSDTGIGHRRGAVGDLRYCINKVNAWPGPDIIDFTVTGTIKLNSALPDLDSEIDIQGPGAQLLTIDAQQKARVLYVAAGVLVEITGLTITGGQTMDPDYWGGGIYNAGGLALQDCSITENQTAGRGGGIYNQGTMLISNCSISGNTTKGAAGGAELYRTWGGGIHNDTGGNLLVRNSLVSENRISPHFSFVAMGAGIANLGNAAIFNSTISQNEANQAGIDTFGGAGGGIYNGGELHVDSSLISLNIVSGDEYASGGGICNGSTGVSYPGGTVTVINSTIADNTALSQGYDPLSGDARGGGISTEKGGTVSVNHSTIAGNHSDGVPQYLPKKGGGISNKGSVLQMHNTILAGNQAKTSGRDISGALADSGYNLFQDSAGGSGYAATDLLDIDPLLGPLQDNGGPTWTMALLPGSPAIDAGDPTIEGAPEFDQRGPGFPRIVNGTIDIGAFEVQATGAPSMSRAAHSATLERLFMILATADLESLT